MTVPAQIGRYRVLRELGRGEWGAAYLACVDDSEREVLVQTLSAPLARDAAIRARFVRQGELALGLRHPNVMEVVEMAEHEGMPYVVIEMMAGASLNHAIESGISIGHSLGIMVQVANGLAFLHECGIVHCDVRPENVFVQADGPPKLMGFEAARPMDAEAGGPLAGTSEYFSPERIMGRSFDGRSDLFSVGCVLFELVTGVRPFGADSPMATF